jgi:hypothetical protein
MPDSSKAEPSVPKPENLFVALLPPWSRSRAQTIMKKSDGERARLLHRVIARENARVRIRTAIIVLPASLLLIHAAPISEPPWYVAVSASLGLTLLACSALTCLPSRLETAALETLSQGEDILYIGPLLAALQKRNLSEPMREKVKQALARLLPHCTQEVFERLTLIQRRSLTGILEDELRPGHLRLHLAVLNLLGQWGERGRLGVLYRYATEEATHPEVRTVARECVEQMCHRLHFGALHRIPEYSEKLLSQLRAIGINAFFDYQVCATCIMALRRMVPQLTADNYKSVLSENHRDLLYQLLIERSLYGNYRYGKNELFLEIIAAAGRLRDTRAIRFLQIIALNEVPTVNAKQMRAAARETIRILEAEVEKERESRTLLRGAASPATQAAHLLRAMPVVSQTAPDELLRPAVVQNELLPFGQGSRSEAEADVLIRHLDSR